MRASWSALHLSLIRNLNRVASEHQFQSMRLQFPCLQSFLSIPDLVEHQHIQRGDAAARYRVIRMLVMAAQSEASFGQVAQMMVMVCLWPGLDAVLGRLARGFPTAYSDLPADILARISAGIITLDLTAVSAVSATLIRNVERDIRRALIADRILSQSMRAIDDPAVEAAASRDASVANGRDLDDWLAALSSTDAKLLRSVFVLGETQEEAGGALGLRPDAARKRFRSALQRLRPTPQK